MNTFTSGKQQIIRMTLLACNTSRNTRTWNTETPKKTGNTSPYLPHGLGFLCSLRGSNLIFHTHCLLSKKLVALLIVTGQGGAETIADNNSKTIQYIFSPRGII